MNKIIKAIAYGREGNALGNPVMDFMVSDEDYEHAYAFGRVHGGYLAYKEKGIWKASVQNYRNQKITFYLNRILLKISPYPGLGTVTNHALNSYDLTNLWVNVNKRHAYCLLRQYNGDKKVVRHFASLGCIFPQITKDEIREFDVEVFDKKPVYQEAILF